MASLRLPQSRGNLQRLPGHAVRFVVGFLIVLMAGAPALAERRVALVMGADKYETLRPLANAVNDARAIERALEALGFEVTSETDRDLRRMRRALADFREDGAGADVALIYFAGHGVEIAGVNSLLPVDADASSRQALEQTSLPLEELRETVAAVAPVGLIVLDACRNDPFGTTAADGRGATALSVSADVRPGLGRVGRAENVLFAFAAAPGRTAGDGDGENSPFTGALARYLATDGLEIRSVLTLVQQAVYDATEGAQLPYVESGLPALFFAAQRGELPERERLLLAMADVTPQMRAEVEAVASDADMPLAPLYAALLSADLASRDPDDRRVELEAAASAFVKVRGEMRALSSDDPAVTVLRLRAEERLAVGAFAEVHAALSEAAELDARSRRSLRANLDARTRSEAATRRLAAGAYEASLDYGSAVAAYREVLALYRELGEDRASIDDMFEIARAGRSVGDISRDLGDLTAAKAAYEETLQLLQRRVPARGEEADLARLIAGVEDDLGDLARISGDFDTAMSRHEAALALREAALAVSPADSMRLRAVATSHDYLGGILSTREDSAGALAAYRKALQLRQRAATLDGAEADAAEVAEDLGVSHFKVAHALLDTGDAAAASQAFRDALAQDEKLVELEPAETRHIRSRIATLNGLAKALKGSGQFRDAIAMQRANRDARAELARKHPEIAALQWDVGAAEREIGLTLRDMGDAEGARVSFETSLATLAPLTEASPDNIAWRYDRAIADYNLADLLLARGEARAAADHFRAARDGWAAVAGREPENARFREVVAAAEAGLGRALAAARTTP